MTKVPLPETIKSASLRGAGIFRKRQNGRLVRWAGVPRLRWAKNKVARAVLELQCPKDRKKVSVEIMASRGTVKVSPAMGKPRGEIYVKVESDLSEQQCSCDLTGDEPVKRLEREIAALIQAEIQDALLKSKGGEGQRIRLRRRSLTKRSSTPGTPKEALKQDVQRFTRPDRRTGGF